GAFSFFFQAEDGIRVFHVTGVQTCALPISPSDRRWPSSSCSRGTPGRCLPPRSPASWVCLGRRPTACWTRWRRRVSSSTCLRNEIGRASCREGRGSVGDAEGGSRKQEGVDE